MKAYARTMENELADESAKRATETIGEYRCWLPVENKERFSLLINGVVVEQPIRNILKEEHRRIKNSQLRLNSNSFREIQQKKEQEEMDRWFNLVKSLNGKLNSSSLKERMHFYFIKLLAHLVPYNKRQFNRGYARRG